MGGVSTIWAPLHRALGRWSNSSNLGFPPNAAPSVDFLASGIQDHRLPYNSRGSSVTQPGIVSWYGDSDPIVANYVPSTIETNNIAAAHTITAATPMTLVSSSGAGITVLTTAAPAFFMPTGLSLSAGVVIDGLPSLHVFGSGGNFQSGFYSRGTYVGRAVSITAASTASVTGTITVAGYDIYGYPMTQTVTPVANQTVNTLKAFKAVTSVTPSYSDTTGGHTYSVGTADVFGFGILATYFGDVTVRWNSALITANNGFVTADVTSPATALTGDVRGTYATQSASDGTKRLIMSVRPTLGLLVTNPTTGLFGQPQV